MAALKAQFSSSKRVRKLNAMRYEAVEDYQKALEIYESILEEDDTNAVLKTKINLKIYLKLKLKSMYISVN